MSYGTQTAVRGKTGQQCEVSGRYDFDGYTDGTRTPAPHPQESRIPLSRGEIFPPIRSSGKACWWLLKERI